jgi:thioredoxin reductase (NADPH)
MRIEVDVKLELTVYSRKGCHLCDVMVAGLQRLQSEYAFDVAVIDIDTDPVLRARYDKDVPVLAHGEHELCRHRLNAGVVAEYLADWAKIRGQ